MAINLTICAEVVDISSDMPRADDVFVVDTNVWYWMTYTKASQVGAHAYQTHAYPNYLSCALAENSRIFQSGFSLAELSHLIERSEHEIFTSVAANVSLKEFRHNFPVQRTTVCDEVEAACAQVLALGDCLEFHMNENASSDAVNRFVREKVDGYDVYLLQSMLASGLVQIITDDGDFATVAGVRVFTANRSVIKAAKEQGKLIVR